MRGSKRRHLSLAQQHLFLTKSSLGDGEGFIKNAKLTWAYEAQPSPISRVYRAALELRQHGTPDVAIMEPDIKALADGRSLPHVYKDPLRLCLYLPKSGQWTRAKRLDQTIIPWTNLWLYFFEDWLVTNDWKGGGKHPDVG